MFSVECLNTSFNKARYVNMENCRSNSEMVNSVATDYWIYVDWIYVENYTSVSQKFWIVSISTGTQTCRTDLLNRYLFKTTHCGKALVFLPT